jgi:hypothetical protein
MTDFKLMNRFGLALCLVLLSSCRFGNYSEDPKPTSSGGYKSVELYFTQATRLTTTAILDEENSTATENNHAPLSAIPVSIRNTFTNPVYFAIPKDPTALPLFIGLNQSSYIETQLDPEGKVYDNYVTQPSKLWNNPECQTQIQIIQDGAFDRTRPGTVTFGDGSVSPVNGRIVMTLSYLRVIAGDCQADLQELANCYSNGSGCDTNQLNAASNLFDLHVRQTGVLDISNATRVRGLAYKVYFE